MFAVCAGIEEMELVEGYKAAGDDYNAILLQAVGGAWRKPYGKSCTLSYAPAFGATRKRIDNQGLIGENYMSASALQASAAEHTKKP